MKTMTPDRALAAILTLACCCFASFSGCVPMPEDALREMKTAAADEPPYKGLDPGHKTYETAHFLVKAYTTETAVAQSVICEQNYARLMNDLGLYSFAPARPYNVVVYRNAEEFARQTGQPRWSGGLAYGNAILIYESESSAAVLAHEMTHLIFNEFMGMANTADLKWVNEGVAVYEETRASVPSRTAYSRRMAELVAVNPIPFSQMLVLSPQTLSESAPQPENGAVQAPQDAAGRNLMVERWYAQAGSVASFMISEGGSLGFSIFITRLKAGDTVDSAVNAAFPGLWRNLGDLEKAWLLHIKG